jgi:SAM-dependent methyltransferase
MSYKHSAPYYDLFDKKENINFYLKLAQKSKGKVLEIGVGTGRVAIPLAKQGIQVVGIDNSPEMLAQAKIKLEKEPSRVQKGIRLIKADMRSFKLNEKFAFIFMASGTYHHCEKTEDQINTLKNINDHLDEKGILAFDLSKTPLTFSTEPVFAGEEKLKDGREIIRYITTKVTPDHKTGETKLIYQIYNKGILEEEFTESGRVSFFDKGGIELLLNKTGFKIENFYGDFDPSQFTPQSPWMVIVALKV